MPRALLWLLNNNSRKQMKYILMVLLSFLTISLPAQTEAKMVFSEGVKLLKAKKFEKAEKKFTTLIENGSNEEVMKMSYIYKGFSLNGQEKYDEAITSFTKSIEIDPNDASTYTDRGLAFSYKKDYDNAILDFQKVLTIDSTGKQAEAAFYYLGRIKSLQFKFDEAIEYLNHLIKLTPKDAEAYFLRGTAKSNKMDIDESIADFDLAIKYRPDYMEALANRGVQKLNKIPVKDKIGKDIKCLEEPCADLLKAKELGDISVDDMIFLYCKECK